MENIKLTIFADYFQFYIQDELVKGDLSESWDDAATNNFIALAPGTVGIRTARNMTVPVDVLLLDETPIYSYDEFDKINECSIEIGSG